MSENNNLPEKYTPASLERVGKLIEIGNKLTKSTNTFTDPRDGKTYKTVKIGTQTWFAENLAYKAESGCWAYDNNQSNVITYGYLYNREASKKVCPIGWHLPSDVEWETLTNYLGGNFPAGGKLKETGTIHWQSPNTGATNETGFSALPGGIRYKDGSFSGIGHSGNWLSSTENSNETHYLDYSLESTGGGSGFNFGVPDGLSVRCLKD